jgi:3-methyladenine DNA glycosylase AlkC
LYRQSKNYGIFSTSPFLTSHATIQFQTRFTEPSRHNTCVSQLKIPTAPRSIQKGSSLGDLLDKQALSCLAHNIRLVHPQFDGSGFQKTALMDLEPLKIMQRGQHIARVLREFLPSNYEAAVRVLVDSLTPPLTTTSDNGMGVFFYLPHTSFVSNYGLDPQHNGGRDPFDVSMLAQYELTRRFTAEFSMRPFLIKWPERTLAQLHAWINDPDPHVRRLCSEGSRPRLPWGMRIPHFIRDPRPVFPILDTLKDDDELYVRRSVANHLGDIAKDHPKLAFELCEKWLDGASAQRKWVIRHAVRHPAKKGDATALRLRLLAK